MAIDKIEGKAVAIHDAPARTVGAATVPAAAPFVAGSPAAEYTRRNAKPWYRRGVFRPRAATEPHRCGEFSSGKYSVTVMLITILVVLNIPVYLFIAWLAFDTKESAADTFFETVVALLQIILLPRSVRLLMGMDDTDAFGLFPILGFFFMCGLLTYGEYWLIQRYVLAS
ncbi:MAG: hypothetical protein HUU20_28460 [Pirellulales bacterium]|nr:hypothetical protein [Pirellulales bacterium]